MKAFHIYITVQIIDSLICIVQKFDQMLSSNCYKLIIKVFLKSYVSGSKFFPCLVTRNVNVKYQSSSMNCWKVINKVKVYKSRPNFTIRAYGKNVATRGKDLSLKLLMFSIKTLAAVVAQSPRAFASHVEGWCSNPSLDIPKSWKR